jgi:hypothetical protein
MIPKGLPPGRNDSRGKYSSDLVLDVYCNLFQEVWDVVSALVGEALLELLLKSAVLKLKDRTPFLAFLKISEEGISWKELREAAPGIAPVEIHRGFQSLITYLFDLFSALAEGVISRELFPKVFPKVREAERIISSK